MAGEGFWRTSGGGDGASSLDDLTDVDVATTPPTNGQALIYDSGSGLWVPGTVSGGGGSGTTELLTSLAYGPAARVTITATSTPTALDTTNLRVTFTAPASGVVLLGLSALAQLDATNTTLNWCVLSGGTRVAASDVVIGYTTVAGVVQSRVFHRIRISGLTAGASISWDFAHYRSFGTGAVKTSYGADASTGGVGAAVMEVWAA